MHFLLNCFSDSCYHCVSFTWLHITSFLIYSYIFSICQSIGSAPFAFKNSLALLKCLQPKKPLYAESGLGWGAVSIRCFGLVSIGILLCAGLPQSMYTIGLSCALTAWITASVKFSQPLPWCELAWCARTVSTVFNSKTPWSAHFFKYPLLGI